MYKPIYIRPCLVPRAAALLHGHLGAETGRLGGAGIGPGGRGGKLSGHLLKLPRGRGATLGLEAELEAEEAPHVVLPELDVGAVHGNVLV